MGCAVLGVPKCRVSLISCTHLWIPTRNGAFSPAMQVEGAPFQTNFDAFYIDKSNECYIMEDARLDPRCAKHPGVKGRPNMRFYCGAPLISRGHLMGILYHWGSEVKPRPSPESITRVEQLASDSVKAVQRDMFECLGVEDEETAAATELPTLWVDVTTPYWKVLGVNKSWETLTGVNLQTLAECEGLLDVMLPSNMDVLLGAVADMHEHPDLSIPAILSPRSAQGSSLQFVLALKPSPTPPPEVAQAKKGRRGGAAVTDSAHSDGANIWVAEVHARIQAKADSFGNLQVCNHCQTMPTTISALSSISTGTTVTTTTGPTSPTHSSGDMFSSGGGGGHYSGGKHYSHSRSSPVLVPVRALEIGSMHIPPRLSSLKRGPLLGKGSYGSVYWGTLGDSQVAIKVMEHAAGPEAAEQLWSAQYESMIASDLFHHDLVRTIDWCGHSDEQGGSVWIVQELCDKGSLSNALKEGRFREGGELEGRPMMCAVLETALEVARGMQYLHSHDVLHGDLSSNNVLLISADNARGFEAKVTDFGLSRALGGQDITTKTVGTVSHMPPEVLMEGLMAKSGDVYSFGVMLFELYTGNRAWAGSSQAQVIFAITCRNEKLKLPEDAPPRYVTLVDACMGDRENRPTFDYIRQELEAMLAQLAGSCTSARNINRGGGDDTNRSVLIS